MKKFPLLSLLVLLLSANVAVAQLQSGTIAPNFTATDINGETYTLYDVLDEGKIVVMDVFATWCPPCWSYHQAHILEDLYKEYGPEGTNELMVFGIEADGSTTMADLQGSTSGSLGNWLNGVSYPVIDDASIGELYNIAYFPTIYHICASRIVTETAQRSIEEFLEFNTTCPVIGGTQNIFVQEYTGYQGTICGTEIFAPAITVQNLAAEAVTSIDVRLIVNGEIAEELALEYDGLESYVPETITFSEITTSGDTELGFEITGVNGEALTTDMPNGNTYAVFLEQAALETQIIYVEIQTDDYGHENYWELTNEAGELVASGGNPRVGMGGQVVATADDPDAYPSGSLIIEEVEIASDCYFFTMYDDYADGMCCSYGQGYYSISDDEGVTLFRGDSFTASKRDKFFNQNSVGVQEIDNLNSLQVTPNPSTDYIQVEISLAERTELSVSVFNNLGQQVRTFDMQSYAGGENQVRLNVQDLPNGIYFVNLQSEEGLNSKRFVVQR